MTYYYIIDLNNGDDQQTSLDKKKIKEKGQYLIKEDKLNKISENFLSTRMSEDETLEVIKNVYEKFAVVLDPHTAIGYGAFDKHNLKGNNIVKACNKKLPTHGGALLSPFEHFLLLAFLSQFSHLLGSK